MRAVLQPGDVLIADANTGWLPHQAVRVVRAVRDVDVYIEQPCLDLRGVPLRAPPHGPSRSCSTRRSTASGSCCARPATSRWTSVNLKISKLGGLTRARQARDLCVSLGIAMTIEDTWGGDIATAAIAHLAHSTPTEFLFTSTDFNSYVTVSTADGAPQRKNGRMAASTAPGLGITPRPEFLTKPAVDVS